MKKQYCEKEEEGGKKGEEAAAGARAGDQEGRESGRAKWEGGEEKEETVSAERREWRKANREQERDCCHDATLSELCSVCHFLGNYFTKALK